LRIEHPEQSDAMAAPLEFLPEREHRVEVASCRRADQSEMNHVANRNRE
jgi:hypothetical protein